MDQQLAVSHQKDPGEVGWQKMSSLGFEMASFGLSPPPPSPVLHCCTATHLTCNANEHGEGQGHCEKVQQLDEVKYLGAILPVEGARKKSEQILH